MATSSYQVKLKTVRILAAGASAARVVSHGRKTVPQRVNTAFGQLKILRTAGILLFLQHRRILHGIRRIGYKLDYFQADFGAVYTCCFIPALS